MGKFYCLAASNLKETLDKFYACTNLPAYAVNYDGIVFYSKGAAQRHIHELEMNKVIDLAYNQFANSNTTSHVVISINKQEYVACYICQKDIKQGVLVFGPYNPRPFDCIPYLITLLRNIQEDTLHKRMQITCQAKTYSLHVQKALSYLARNYNKPLTLESMARHLKINKCYFAAILKEETGETFSNTLNKIRVERSKELLKQENYSILDVALSVGFSNQNYFSTIFKRMTNMTPSEYRQKMEAS
mgnify:CR=1 FL=1